MPTDTENKKERTRREGSGVSIVIWWQKFHFSGRVIMCSVLFGLGLVLIGGIIFAINMNDDSGKSGNGNLPDEIPSKPPSNVVGPVIMGIGGFIVTVGVIMCLFETQVCRKKPADASPLITENTSDHENKETEPKEVPSKTHKQGHGHRSHNGNKHGARKTPGSPKRSKHHHGKSHSKEKREKTPPVSIETSKSFMTSSEDKFLTPPNTLEHTSVVRTSSREVESQTSSSLMKSFTSSGPSWTQSTEFQTPSTSFHDSSVSLENSTEVSKKEKLKNVMQNELVMNSGFMTPLILEEEKMQKMATNIQNKEKEAINSSSEREMNLDVIKANDEPNINITLESERSAENKDLKLLNIRNEDKSVERNKTDKDRSNVTGYQSVDVSAIKNVKETENREGTDLINDHDTLNVEDIKKILDKSPGDIQKKIHGNEISVQIGTTADEQTTAIPRDDRKEKLNPEEDTTQDVSGLIQKEQPNVLLDEKVKGLLRDANQDNTHNDIESSTSSGETVVSQSSVLEKPLKVSKSERNELEGNVNLMNQDVNLGTVLENPINAAESKESELGEKLSSTNQNVELDSADSNEDAVLKNNTELQSNLSSLLDENKVKPTDSMSSQKDLKVNESFINLSPAEASEGTISPKTDFVDTHNIQADISSAYEAKTSNLKQSEENNVQDVIAEEKTKSNLS